MYIGHTKPNVRMTNLEPGPNRPLGEKPRNKRNTQYTMRNANSGFSLAEAMIATAVLAVASLGMVIPFSSGAAARAEGNHRTIAAALAVDLMEQIVGTQPDQIVAAWNGYAEARGAVVKDFATATLFSDLAYADFSRTCTCQYVYVAQQAGGPSPNFLTVTVTVAYQQNTLSSITKLITQ